MSTFVVNLKTCVGCSPMYTYVYEVSGMSPDVKLIKTETKLPQPGVMGGSKTYQFTFAWNRHTATQLPYVHFRKNNRLGQAVSDMLYTVNPMTLESVLVNTSDAGAEKDHGFL
jgi:hypothetical protein